MSRELWHFQRVLIWYDSATRCTDNMQGYVQHHTCILRFPNLQYLDKWWMFMGSWASQGKVKHIRMEDLVLSMHFIHFSQQLSWLFDAIWNHWKCLRYAAGRFTTCKYDLLVPSRDSVVLEFGNCLHMKIYSLKQCNLESVSINYTQVQSSFKFQGICSTWSLWNIRSCCWLFFYYWADTCGAYLVLVCHDCYNFSYFTSFLLCRVLMANSFAARS